MKGNRRLGIFSILSFLVAFLLTAMGTMPASATDGYTLQVVEKAAVQADFHWKGTLVEGWHIHFTAAQKRRLERPSNCIWSDGRNYYSKVDTNHGWHWDTNMHLCRSKKSPTGWVKVGGGQTGSHCFNVAAPSHVPPLPHVPQILGPITETWSFSRYFAHLKASEGIRLHVVADCGPAHIDTLVWTKGIVEGSALLKVFLKSNGRMSSFNAKLSTALVLSAKSSSAVKVLITCTTTPPPPPTPTYSCDTLHVTPGDNRSVTIDTFSTSASGGATFKNAVINWGDGTSGTFNSPVGQTHTFGADGTYTISATAHFDVNGNDVSATSNGCQQAVTFTPPTVQKPVIVDVTQIQPEHGMQQGGTSPNFHITSDKLGSQGGTLYLRAKYGHFEDANGNVVTTAQVTNNVPLTVTYVAPNDVSASSTWTEVLTFDLTDNATKAQADTVTESFGIDPAPVRP